MNENLLKIFGIVGMGVLLFAMWYVFIGRNSGGDSIIQETSNMNPFEKLRASRSVTEIKPDPFERAANQQVVTSLDEEYVGKQGENELNDAEDGKEKCDTIRRLVHGCSSKDYDSSKKETASDQKIDYKSDALDEQENEHIKKTSYSHTSNIYAPPKTEDTSKPTSGLSQWAGLIANDASVIKGRSTIYPGKVIRAGCRVLGVIQDELKVSSGEEHSLVINVRGPLNGCSLPPVQGLRLVASAKLNSMENRIKAIVSTCSDTSANRKSVACKAQVKSITGIDGLEGEIYDRSGWGVLLEFLMATGSAPVVGKLMETAANSQTMWGAEAAAQIASSLQNSVDRIAQKISKAFEGREIHLAENATVIITFTEDVVL